MKCCGSEQDTPYCGWCGTVLRKPAAQAESNGQASVYGYARASRSSQIKSTDVQEELIEAKAVTIPDAQWVHCRVDRGISATKIRWNDAQRRPEFSKLMRELHAGDHLVIWRMDRLERSMFGMIDCLRWLVERGVSVHILEHGGMQLDLDKPMGRLLVMILAGFAGFFSAQLSEQTKASKAYRRAHGLSADRCPTMGKIWKKVTRNGKSDRLEFWDKHQCDLIREIKHRFDHGETMVEIVRDFYRREEKMWNGKPWAVRCKGHYRKAKRYSKTEWYSRRFYHFYWKYTEMLAEGKDMQDLPVNPKLQALAQRQLGQRRRQRNTTFEAMERVSLDGLIPARAKRVAEPWEPIEP
jgi:DNA invertase Pin-like site-specific DNA recombinase